MSEEAVEYNGFVRPASREDALELVYTTGLRMRRTAVVDDDFPVMMRDFDSALRAMNAYEDHECEWVTSMRPDILQGEFCHICGVRKI